MTVMFALIESTVSSHFTFALANFERKTLDLTKFYQWRGGVLPLKLDFYTHIAEFHYFDLPW